MLTTENLFELASGYYAAVVVTDIDNGLLQGNRFRDDGSIGFATR